MEAVRAFCCSIGDGIGWFRVFGFGLWWKDSSRHRLLFSQRNNISRFVRVGAWLFEVITPWKP